jgi:hypothetical protein
MRYAIWDARFIIQARKILTGKLTTANCQPATERRQESEGIDCGPPEPEIFKR